MNQTMRMSRDDNRQIVGRSSSVNSIHVKFCKKKKKTLLDYYYVDYKVPSFVSVMWFNM